MIGETLQIQLVILSIFYIVLLKIKTKSFKSIEKKMHCHEAYGVHGLCPRMLMLDLKLSWLSKTRLLLWI
jgi:hypothetical protein